MHIENILNSVIKLFIIITVSIIIPISVQAAEDTVKVGVLANRGYEHCKKRWEPTIRYLTEKVPPYKFELIPLAFDEILPAIQNRKIDFIICNSAIFVDIEAINSATAIATIKTKLLNGYYSVFGGVIFTRSGNSSIKTLHDLKGKTFLAADMKSLGGWQVQWRELKKAGIDPYRDFSKLNFSGQHDTVVFEVLKGNADAGACRTDVLESLASTGKIKLTDINVITEDIDLQRSKEEFPFLISTRLYPEWPFAKLFHTSPEIALRVSLALQSMKVNDAATVAGEYGGWSYPLNYKPVQELQMDLQIGYYKRLAPMGIGEIFYKYWKEITVALLLFITIMVTLMLVIILYRQQLALKKELDIELQENKISSDKIKSLLAEKEIILKEVHHRIKNNMNTVKGLLYLQAETLTDSSAVAALDDAENRVGCMMVLYDKLYRSEGFTELSIKEYLPALVDEIIGNFTGKKRVEIENHIEDFILKADTLVTLGIMLNELLTNIMKYAFIGRDSGIINVSASMEDNHVTIIIADNGVGMPESICFENSTGFGMQLVGMLTQQIGGSIKIERENGTRFVLEFKV